MSAGQGGFQLLLTLALMFFGALGAGYLPYYINVKDAKLNAMTALGGGLLIGSALSVVIPEGFRSFYDIQQTGTSHSLSGLALVLGFIAMVVLDRVQASSIEKGVPSRQERALAQERDVETGGDAVGEQYKAVPKGKPDSDADFVENNTEAKKVFKNQLYDEHSSANVLHLAPCAHRSIASKSPDRAITGLLVHCAADGLAMGSAFLSENPSLGLLVGLAMVIHKAPMAFGLSAYLQSCHWSWSKAQKTLILFSAAAPASTMVTYTILSMVPIFNSGTATSMAILFSGGTFLQAATMHILPDALTHESMSMEVLGAFTLGCFFPSFLSYIGHHHH
jgi:zinc transporter 9